MLKLLFVVSIALALLKCYWNKKSGLVKLPYPPGPSPLPLLGNLRNIPKSYPWITYTEQKHEYGKYYSFA